MLVSYRMPIIYLATSNKHKFAEARNILSKYSLRLEMVNVKTFEVQLDDLERIAIEASKNALKKMKKPIMVEDSGLFIEILSGFPGPYSSYANRTIGIRGVLKLLEGAVERNAEFHSAVAYATPSEQPKIFVGITEGSISTEPRGNGGFGFDPIFIPKGSDKTFGEMPLEEKNRHSHRAKAFIKFAEWYLL
jgi:XTP/dITP diphosphohydrolase